MCNVKESGKFGLKLTLDSIRFILEIALGEGACKNLAKTWGTAISETLKLAV